MQPHILALNTAEGRLQMLIARDDDGAAEPRFAASWHAPSQGAELLAPALRDACGRLGISPADIRRIAVVRGPGSFTGIRLALVTASGLARATGARVGGIDYLPLLTDSALDLVAPVRALIPGQKGVVPQKGAIAAPGNVRARQKPLLLCALTHARRSLLYLQVFAWAGQGRPTALTDIMVLDPQKAAQNIAAIRMSPDAPTHPQGALPDCLLFGSGLGNNREALATSLAVHGLADAALLPQGFDHPTPAALLRAATIADYDRADVAPLYVRPSDAEDNLENIAAKLGLVPEQAIRRFMSLSKTRH